MVLDTSKYVTTFNLLISCDRDPFRRFNDKLKNQTCSRFHDVDGSVEVNKLDANDRILRFAAR